MERKRFGNTDLKVSKIAMGGIPIMRLSKEDAVKVIRDVINMGINFIDTANGYGDSEEKIGEAIKIFKRNNLVLSSKSAARDKKAILSHIDLSLKRLGTDYIDIYQLHCVSNKEDFEKVMSPKGAYEGLEDAVSNGKIRYYAFSSHNPKIAEKMMGTERFQVTQIPLNFIDTEPEEKLIPLAHKLNIGFIAMKPMGGGMLEDADLAFRYLAQFEEIVPDPGIEKTEEMEEIINIVKNPRPFTEKEKQKIKRIKKEFGNSWCHRCGYCQPCPEGIPITTVLITQSMIKRVDYDSVIGFQEKAIEKAGECVECRECVEKCPYDLDIPALLKENIEIWKKFKKEHENL
ncbi:MAG: aldo/keto reductase [Actinobacteria bacterium]|nr:aldo/keto reductase [Actinomycetota bacterium]